MINIKKIDEKDFVFVNEPLSKEEEKEFSEFLKSRKTKAPAKRKEVHKTSPRKHYA